MTYFLKTERREKLYNELVSLTCPKDYAEQLTREVPEDISLPDLDAAIAKIANDIIHWAGEMTKSAASNDAEEAEMFHCYILADTYRLAAHIAECRERNLLKAESLPRLLNALQQSGAKIKELTDQLTTHLGVPAKPH